MEGSVPEVVEGYDAEQGPEEEDGDEAGDGAGLELENPVLIYSLAVVAMLMLHHLLFPVRARPIESAQNQRRRE